MSLYQLLMSPDCQQKYNLTAHNKAHIMRVSPSVCLSVCLSPGVVDTVKPPAHILTKMVSD